MSSDRGKGCLPAGLLCVLLLLGCRAEPQSGPKSEAAPDESRTAKPSAPQDVDSAAAAQQPAADAGLVDLATLDHAVSAGARNWPQFRGPNRDATSQETGLLRKWPEGGPKVLWQTGVCEGYAGPAVFDGLVYFHDYSPKETTWMVRCVTLKEGKHVWRFGDKKPGGIRVHHGITRTVPAVDGKFVFSLDPKGVFHCLDARTGKELWRKDVPAEYATLIPQWYVGQCPLVEPDRVVIAPGGRALFAAFDKATGNVLWETPDEEKTVMGHASVMPADIGGVKQYVHCNIKGAAAADANGRLLWRFPWKFNIVAPVSPLPIGDGRIFLTSCYEAVTVMIRVTREGDQFVAKKEFSLGEGGWNSEVHTPILFRDHLFAVGKKKNGLLTCLDLNGNIVWESGNTFFELGSYLLADRMLFVLEGKTGVLRLVEASTSGYRELDHAGVLHGKDVLGPMALSDGKLVLRDMTTMKCIQVGAP